MPFFFFLFLLCFFPSFRAHRPSRVLRPRPAPRRRTCSSHAGGLALAPRRRVELQRRPRTTTSEAAAPCESSSAPFPTPTDALGLTPAAVPCDSGGALRAELRTQPCARHRASERTRSCAMALRRCPLLGRARLRAGGRARPRTMALRPGLCRWPLPDDPMTRPTTSTAALTAARRRAPVAAHEASTDNPGGRGPSSGGQATMRPGNLHA